MLPGGVPGNLGSGATVCHMLAKRGSKAGGESRSDRLLGPEGGGGAHRESSSSVGGGRLEFLLIYAEAMLYLGAPRASPPRFLVFGCVVL